MVTEPDTPPKRPHRSVVGAAIGSFVFFWIAPVTVAGLVPYLLSGWQVHPPLMTDGDRLIGTVVIVTGAVILLECFARFAVKGRGTPAPVSPTETLVASGLYRHVRNPMYVAVVAIIAGQGLLLGRVVLFQYAVIVWLLFHLFVRFYEEPTLRRQFGDSYDEYQASVSRWWPRFRPRSSRAPDGRG
jgi:protein-S-isoprenylcysteine O-methyltransferase Ste14